MSDSVKLLYIIDYYKNPFAGTEGQLLKLIDGLDRNSYEATFVVFNHSDYLKENNFPIPVDVLDIQRLASPLSWIKLYRYFLRKKKQGYRLAHIFFNDASIICPPVLKLLGYKVIVSRRDMGYWYTLLNRIILKLNALFVDRVIANSRAVKVVTMEQEGYASSAVEVIYNGYQVAPVGCDDFPADIDVEPGTIRIALVANIRPIKRIHDAIEALALVVAQDINVMLYVIGDGVQDELLAQARELGVSRSVIFIGSVCNVLAILPEFHAGILCSESEGFSNTLIEYMQAGLPVVCSSVGGNPELVEHDVNGYLYQVGDVRALAEHISELATDDGLRCRLGQAGAKRVADRYSMERYLVCHQDLYRLLLR